MASDRNRLRRGTTGSANDCVDVAKRFEVVFEVSSGFITTRHTFVFCTDLAIEVRKDSRFD